jgi:hypothetical protein
MTEPEFAVREQAVATAILDGRNMLDEVRRIRAEKLEQGIHYRQVGKLVLYSESGIEAVRALIGVGTGGDGSPPALRPPERPKTERVRVTRVFEKNLKFMDGVLVKDGARVTIRVRDSRMFAPGMTMECASDGGALWEYLGRLPRARGVW